MDSHDPDDDLLHLSICGRRYSMTKSRASQIDGSLFQLLSSRVPVQTLAVPGVHWIHDEFLIERSPVLFDIVLHYVLTGHVNRPSHICPAALDEEFGFWRLDPTTMTSPNCCAPHESGRRTSEGVVSLRRGSRCPVIRSDKAGTMRKVLDDLWRFCEDPESSRKALIFNLICIFSILISIANLVIGTIPRFQHCNDSAISFLQTAALSEYTVQGAYPQNYTTVSGTLNFSILNNATSQTTPHLKLRRANEKFSHTCDGGLVFDLIELVCIIWFTIELLLRFVSCPDRLSFVKSPLNIIDFLATFPFYVELAVWAGGWITDLNRVSSVSSVLLMLRVMRVLRAFRVLRLARYFDSLQIMGETLWESRRDMGLLVLFLGVGVLIFSTILFYVEKDVDNTAYTSIPAAFWWAIVTLTTTGYGDVTPQTVPGKIVAGVACIAGVLILAFPVSILVEHFRLSYACRRGSVTGRSSFASGTGVGAAQVADVMRMRSVVAKFKNYGNGVLLGEEERMIVT